jgi:hypothetical protein
MAEEEVDDTMEIFDLSADVDITELDDEGLLFRESIIKTFYETATRTGKAVYGFTKDELQEMANEIVEEFRTRGRDYQVPLDRSTVADCSISRLHGQELMSGEDDAPATVTSIVNTAYKACRKAWVAEHPEELNDHIDMVENTNDDKSNCKKIAWQAAIDAGWKQDNDGEWKKQGSSGSTKVAKSAKTLDFFRFVSDGEVRLRTHEFVSGKCEYCQYFNNVRCSVLEHIVGPAQVCDAYSGSYFFEESERKIVVEDFKGLISGLMSRQPLQNLVVRSLDSPVGILIIMRDNLETSHYFSITMNDFMENMVSRHHWTQDEVNKLSGFGGHAQ